MTIPKPAESAYKATLGDRIVPRICNWLIRNFTSDLYYAYVSALLALGRKGLDATLREGDV